MLNKSFSSLASRGKVGRSFDRTAAPATIANNAVLVFLGRCVVFSDRLLRTVEFEFDEIDVIRLHNLEELNQLDDQTRRAIQLIIFDDASVEMLPRSASELERATHGVGAVLAYFSPETARNILNESRELGTETLIRFLPMKAPFDAWLAALKLLLLGETFVPAELLERRRDVRHPPLGQDCTPDLAQAEKPQAAEQSQSLPNLTTRESQVLTLLAGGMPNKSIADELGLSQHTVKLHVHHIFGKLGVQNRTSATKWYFLRGVPQEQSRAEKL